MSSCWPTKDEKTYLGALEAALQGRGSTPLGYGPQNWRGSESRTGRTYYLHPAKDAKHGYVTVRARNAKNSRTRNIPLTDRAADDSKGADSRKVSGYVFHRPDGSQSYQTWLNQQHSAARESLKLPDDFVLHSLRHTFGTRLGEAGADTFTIMKLMGHSSCYCLISPDTFTLRQSRWKTP